MPAASSVCAGIVTTDSTDLTATNIGAFLSRSHRNTGEDTANACETPVVVEKALSGA
jgi:hypothetical protein